MARRTTHRRGWLAALAVIALMVVACGGDAAETTTTPAPTTTLVTTTTTDSGRITLQPNDPPFLVQGQGGAHVEALQTYLVCSGHGQIGPDGPMVTIDGAYGPITADAVAMYQAELRRIPTGDPDEATYAMLARDCNEERALDFDAGGGVQRIAGNVTEGDSEIFNMAGADGRVLTMVVAEGGVEVTLEKSDGTLVQSVAAGGGWSGKLDSETDYRLVVSAATVTNYEVDLEVARPRFITIDFGRMTLSPDGLGIVAFGDDAERVITRLTDLLGEPSADSGWELGDSGGRTCRGTNRHLTWVIQAADTGLEHPAVFTADFSDLASGSQAFAQYSYASEDPRAVDAGAMELATTQGLTVGRSRDEFVALYGQPNFHDGTRGLTYGGGMLMGIVTVGEADYIYYVGAGQDGCDDFQ
jgi:hypothetical protein